MPDPEAFAGHLGPCADPRSASSEREGEPASVDPEAGRPPSTRSSGIYEELRDRLARLQGAHAHLLRGDPDGTWPPLSPVLLDPLAHTPSDSSTGP